MAQLLGTLSGWRARGAAGRAGPGGPGTRPLAAYRAGIDAFNASQPNRALLDALRAHDHRVVDEMDGIRPLAGCLVLDVGASPHGYALERVLERGAALYAGIGLDVAAPEYVVGERGNVGLLLNMNGEALAFPDAMFDWVVSISTFEHAADVGALLREIARVLKVGGLALVSFEPVWSCSYGHHLHHFGACARVVPPWGHLLRTPDEMRRLLTGRWPADAPLSLDAALDWIYAGPALNRLTIRQHRERFAGGPLAVEWSVDLREEGVDPAAAREAAARTGLSVEELTTKGLSLLLRKA